MGQGDGDVGAGAGPDDEDVAEVAVREPAVDLRRRTVLTGLVDRQHRLVGHPVGGDGVQPPSPVYSDIPVIRRPDVAAGLGADRQADDTDHRDRRQADQGQAGAEAHEREQDADDREPRDGGVVPSADRR